MEFGKIKEIVNNAIERFLIKDATNLLNEVHGATEICICHRIAMYLEGIVKQKEWVVDIEYNLVREYHEVKRWGTDSDKGWTRPDLIIHKRKSIDRSGNLLWCQAKWIHRNQNTENDIYYLKLLTDKKRMYPSIENGNIPNYQYGLFLIFNNSHIQLKSIIPLWFINGSITNVDDLNELRKYKRSFADEIDKGLKKKYVE